MMLYAKKSLDIFITVSVYIIIYWQESILLIVRDGHKNLSFGLIKGLNFARVSY